MMAEGAAPRQPDFARPARGELATLGERGVGMSPRALLLLLANGTFLLRPTGDEAEGVCNGEVEQEAWDETVLEEQVAAEDGLDGGPELRDAGRPSLCQGNAHRRHWPPSSLLPCADAPAPDRAKLRDGRPRAWASSQSRVPGNRLGPPDASWWRNIAIEGPQACRAPQASPDLGRAVAQWARFREAMISELRNSDSIRQA